MNHHWLLELTVQGQVLRYAVDVVTVSGHTYRAGLADLLLQRGATSVGISIMDEGRPWATIASIIEGSPAELRRVADGGELADAVTYLSGEATGVEVGVRTEPVTFTIEQPVGADVDAGLGLQLPDRLAKVDPTTWPDGGGANIGETGGVYPILFGRPGWDGSTVTPVMPVPLAQIGGALIDTIALLAEDGSTALTGASSLVIRNDGQNSETTLTPTTGLDLRSRRVLQVTIPDGSPLEPLTGDTTKYFVGYNASGGSSVRPMSEVFKYVLSRWGGAATDWARLSAVLPDLAVYQVDTWIDDPVPDPWDWLEETFSTFIPFEVRQGKGGRYLKATRFVARAANAIGRFDVGAGAERLSQWQRSDALYNEFSAEYRPTLAGDFAGQVILTGRADRLASAALGVSATPGGGPSSTLVVPSAGCQRALAAQRGVRQAPPLRLDWTWDTGTAIAVLAWQVERDAVPALTATYAIRGGDALEEGQTLLLTDAELGLAAVPCIVDGPPAADRSAWANVSLRRGA